MSVYCHPTFADAVAHAHRWQDAALCDAALCRYAYGQCSIVLNVRGGYLVGTGNHPDAVYVTLGDHAKVRQAHLTRMQLIANIERYRESLLKR